MIHSWNCWEEACRTHPCFFGIALAGGLIMLLKRGSRRPEWIRKTVATHSRVPEIRKLSDRISAVGPSVDLESCVQGLDGAPGTSEREAASLAGPHGEGSVMRTRAVWEVRTLPEHRPGLDSRARRPPDRALSPGLPLCSLLSTNKTASRTDTLLWPAPVTASAMHTVSPLWEWTFPSHTVIHSVVTGTACGSHGSVSPCGLWPAVVFLLDGGLTVPPAQ